MSTQRGNVKKQGQTYQNKYKFKPNFKGMTKADFKILEETPLDHLCQRCLDILQWKVDFQKYKTLSAHRKCETCKKPSIFKNYRLICDGCAEKGKADGILLCTKCKVNVRTVPNAEGQMKYAKPANSSKLEEIQYEKHVDEIEKALESLKLRDRKGIERKIKSGDVKYDRKLKKFVYIDDEDKVLDQRNKGGVEEEDDDYDDEDMMDSDDDQKEEEKKIDKKKSKKEKKKQVKDDDSWADEDSGEEVIDEKAKDKKEKKEAKDSDNSWEDEDSGEEVKDDSKQ